MADESTQAEPTPEELRRDIEQTREQLGDTVDALAYKADVKSRAKENVEERTKELKGELKEKPAIPAAAVAIVAALVALLVLKRRRS